MMAERESRVILIALISMLAPYLLESQLCLRADIEEMAAHPSLKKGFRSFLMRNKSHALCACG